MRDIEDRDDATSGAGAPAEPAEAARPGLFSAALAGLVVLGGLSLLIARASGSGPTAADQPSVSFAPESAAASPGGAVMPRQRPHAPDLPPDLRAQQAEAYAAARAKTILDLQPFRRTMSQRTTGPDGREGVATLVNLNPGINEWYLLELRWTSGEESRHHLVNVRPREQDLELGPAAPGGIVVSRASTQQACDLWSSQATPQLAEAARARGPYQRLCGGEVLLHLKTRGARTPEEWAADLLRDNLKSGEKLTVFVRKTLYADSQLEKPELRRAGAATPPPLEGPDLPRAASVTAARRQEVILPRELGIHTDAAAGMFLGRWYAVSAQPGVHVSSVTPGGTQVEIPERHRSRLRELDGVEREALVYLVAFDLERFELGFVTGTDHPRVAWSERALESARIPGLPGPDGIEEIAPLVSTGLLAPNLAPRAAATFAGGFKRSHGAFRFGALAQVNAASHYGFIESGAILSKLQPGLSTLFSLEDGRVEMKTWTRQDDALLERIRFARQNGVALLEHDAASGATVPGALVASWGEGNWSGTQDKKLRAVRAGVCLQDTGERRFLIYGYFSSATPSAMARVFAAYGCSYAMHLDMNALEHTYLALYHDQQGRLGVQHLVRGMNVLDKGGKGGEAGVVPRFIGFADNRDFFYLLRKPAAAPASDVATPTAPPPQPENLTTEQPAAGS